MLPQNPENRNDDHLVERSSKWKFSTKFLSDPRVLPTLCGLTALTLAIAMLVFAFKISPNGNPNVKSDSNSRANIEYDQKLVETILLNRPDLMKDANQ